jgi:hypothetical protein
VPDGHYRQHHIAIAQLVQQLDDQLLIDRIVLGHQHRYRLGTTGACHRLSFGRFLCRSRHLVATQ